MASLARNCLAKKGHVRIERCEGTSGLLDLNGPLTALCAARRYYPRQLHLNPSPPDDCRVASSSAFGSYLRSNAAGPDSGCGARPGRVQLRAEPLRKARFDRWIARYSQPQPLARPPNIEVRPSCFCHRPITRVNTRTSPDVAHRPGKPAASARYSPTVNLMLSPMRSAENISTGRLQGSRASASVSRTTCVEGNTGSHHSDRTWLRSTGDVWGLGGCKRDRGRHRHVGRIVVTTSYGGDLLRGWNRR